MFADPDPGLFCRILIRNISSLDPGRLCNAGYNEFVFFLENEEHRPFDGCKIEI
jgi:hypothetical protein